MLYKYGLMQDCSNSIANALDSLQSYIKQSICSFIIYANQLYFDTEHELFRMVQILIFVHTDSLPQTYATLSLLGCGNLCLIL